MTERRASVTAVLVCQGRAVADGRYAVGLFADPVAAQLLDPPEREVVDRVRAGLRPTPGEWLRQEMARRVSVVMVPRTIAIDDAVRASGARQVVILGAGLDARAWRMPELAACTTFEVDHPASQSDKRRRAAGLPPTAGRHVWVAADLAREPLGPALEAAGFDKREPAAWVWEGVVPYLTADEVRATVTQLAELSASGNLLVVNYQAASLVVSVGSRVMRTVWRTLRQTDVFAGEPWRSLWDPPKMREMLQDNGFDVTSDLDLVGLSAGLDLPVWAGPSLGNSRVTTAVRR